MADPIANAGIVATAFDLVEQRPPSSLTDDSEEAALANRMWPRAIEGLLEVTDWSFARGIRTLQEADAEASDIATDADLPHLYTIHPAILKGWRVLDWGVAWRRDGLFLRADLGGGLTVRATLRLTNESQTPQSFQLAVAARLAVLMAPSLSTSLSKRQQLISDAKGALEDALAADGRQGSEERYDGLEEQGDWVTEAIR